MSISEKVKGFLGLSGPFSQTAAYLAEHGYNARYMQMLEELLPTLKSKRDTEDCKALIAQGYLFRGELKKAEEHFTGVDISLMSRESRPAFANNHVLCLFLLKKEGQMLKTFAEYESYILQDDTLLRRRSIALREFANGDYEAAVTVLVKLMSEADSRATLMADICLVRTMLRLDMYRQADEIARRQFDRYKGKFELTALATSLENSIRKGLR